MEENKKLFAEFPPIPAEQWLQQVIRDLKGEDFNEKLTYTTPDGITVKPFYTLEDGLNRDERKPLFSHTDWEVCEEIDVTDEKIANKKALHALNNGASGLVFHLDANANLDTLLNEIQIQYIAVQFVLSGDAAVFIKNTERYILSRQLDAKQLNVCVNVDPVAAVLRSGIWEKPVDTAKEELKALFSTENSFRTINVNAAAYQQAGAPQAYEIGCALAHLNEYMGWLNESGTAAKAFNTKIQLNVSVGPDYFFEIAKLRAYRKVMALFLDTYGIQPEIYIHAQTSFRTMTAMDAYNNLLRATTEAMSATIGGCNSLSVLPFDATYNESDNEFSDRLSRNIQLILKSESYFDKIADAAAGTYFIEELTEQLAEKAWEDFREIEQAGGMIACIENGKIQSAINAFAAKAQEDFDSGKSVLVGTNKFPNAEEEKKASVIVGNEERKGEKGLDLSRIAVNNEK